MVLSKCCGVGCAGARHPDGAGLGGASPSERSHRAHLPPHGSLLVSRPPCTRVSHPLQPIYNPSCQVPLFCIAWLCTWPHTLHAGRSLTRAHVRGPRAMTPWLLHKRDARPCGGQDYRVFGDGRGHGPGRRMLAPAERDRQDAARPRRAGLCSAGAGDAAGSRRRAAPQARRAPQVHNPNPNPNILAHLCCLCGRPCSSSRAHQTSGPQAHSVLRALPAMTKSALPCAGVCQRLWQHSLTPLC